MKDLINRWTRRIWSKIIGCLQQANKLELYVVLRWFSSMVFRFSEQNFSFYLLFIFWYNLYTSSLVTPLLIFCICYLSFETNIAICKGWFDWLINVPSSALAVSGAIGAKFAKEALILHCPLPLSIPTKRKKILCCFDASKACFF